MGGVIGIDLQAAMSVAAALGYDAYWMAQLLPYGEAGLVEALNADKDQHDIKNG